MQLPGFLLKLTKLNRAYVPGKGMAPHKPVLLLALADWFEAKAPTTNHLPFDEDLLRLFKENWELLALGYAPYKPDYITKPYYYLKSEGFWMPTDKDGPLRENSHGSPTSLLKAHAAVSLSEEAFHCYQQPVERELVRMKLLDTYFPYTKHQYIEAKGMDGLILDIEAELLQEPSASPRYAKTVTGMKEKAGFIRDQKFQPLLLQIYEYTCCITGLRVEGAPVVEACHIKRHADCGINSLNNGIALCANLHRAFDYGLIGLSDDYHVLVKKGLKESDTAYSLKALAGKKIRLPKEVRFWPGREWVRGQREN